MATAAAIAAAAATAVAAGVSAASQAGAFGPGSPDQPKFQQVPKRPFETAQQRYMTRVMMSNLNNRGPNYQDWLKSGGTAEFQLNTPGMTPMEASGMGFTGPRGEKIPYYDPTTGGGQLSPEQTLYLARQRARDARSRGEFAHGWDEQLINVSRQYNKLNDMANRTPQQERKLGRLRDRLTQRLGGTPPSAAGKYDPNYPRGEGDFYPGTEPKPGGMTSFLDTPDPSKWSA